MLAVALLAVHVQVIIPDPHNLQDLAFWVALGGGYFREEQVDVELAISDTPADSRQLLAKRDAQMAVLPPPLYLELIGDRAPWLLVANLMQNDGINLIIRRSVAAARGISPSQPLVERLRRLKGLKIGVAPGPRTRLRTLFESAGLEVEDFVEPVILTGQEQNGAFAEGRVDVLFTHTPFLERALVEEDALMLVNQSAGEVPQLAFRQIHSLCARSTFAEANPALVRRMIRAIARAEKLIHSDREATIQAVKRAQPQFDPRLLQTIVDIYRPAIPATPAVSTEGLRGALRLYPAGKVPPTLPDDLGPYVLKLPATLARRDQGLQ
jgi:NitT/TauT family transport system substrate-binding protein